MVSKSIIFLVKSFLGNFYRNLATFIWSHCRPDTFAVLTVRQYRVCYKQSFLTKMPSKCKKLIAIPKKAFNSVPKVSLHHRVSFAVSNIIRRFSFSTRRVCYRKVFSWKTSSKGTTIAQWIRLCLPSFNPLRNQLN